MTSWKHDASFSCANALVDIVVAIKWPTLGWRGVSDSRSAASSDNAMSSKAITVALVLGLAALAAANYCSVCSDHTMCKYTTTKAGSACKNYKWTALTSTNKAAAVKAHNDLRNKVALGQEKRGLKAQPSASNMRKMVSSVAADLTWH